MILAVIVLGILLTAVLLRIFFLKREVRRLNLALLAIINADTNALLTTHVSDRDITAFAKSVNTVLEHARKSFLEKNRVETDLKRAITNISHDLRTPLTSAKGYLQMIKDGGPDEATASQYHAIIADRLEALAELMDNLFEFSQAVEGNVTLGRVNVGNVLRDGLSANFLELERKGFTVECFIPDAPVYCLCDENALARIMQNLIKNAAIHGKEYLRVELTAGGDAVTFESNLKQAEAANSVAPLRPHREAGLNQDRYTIEIANKADGLNQIDTRQIFERFYTVDASRTNKRTGLGLAIAKELTEKMDGDISAAIDGDMFIVRVCLAAG